MYILFTILSYGPPKIKKAARMHGNTMSTNNAMIGFPRTVTLAKITGMTQGTMTTNSDTILITTSLTCI